VALDLLATSSLLRRHALDGKIVMGVNHTMIDFATGRKKDLDLVIARPGAGTDTGPGALLDGMLDLGTDASTIHRVGTFAGLAAGYGARLTDVEQATLAALPEVPVADSVGAVLVALEAKACMTAHVKSLPRLYDELNSSHLCVHGASRQALAIGYVQVNAADTFVSPVINSRGRRADGEYEVTTHRQPADTERVLTKIAEIPRRSASSETGFDGIAVTVLDLRNDGSPVRLVTAPPAPQPGDSFSYDAMIVRMANEYDTTFAYI
jgi:hypothetical protein